MSDNINLGFAIGLPPEKAIEYFKSKGDIFSWDWYDTWQEAHSKVFTVAKVVRMDILTDIRNMIQKSIDEGVTFQQFKKELEPKLKDKGWWGVVKDEEGNEIQYGSPWRLKTIYQTNLNTAYSSGRYKSMMDNAEKRPYWQYWAVMDGRTRDEHGALNGKVFRYDDPFWDSFYPPNGFNCRCKVRALNDRNIKNKGIEVESSEGLLGSQEKLVSKKSGEWKEVATYDTGVRDPATGKSIKVSPNVGWNYNPGKVKWDPDLSKYADDLIEQYKQDVDTNTKIAEFIDKDARKEVEDYFGMETGLSENNFYKIQDEYDQALRKLEKELGEDYDKNRITRAFYYSGEINYSPEVINNSRTGTIKNGIKTIVHENIHAIGRYSSVNVEGTPDMRDFLSEGLAELFTRKVLTEKYGVDTEELFYSTYQDECSDTVIQLMIKHDFNKEAIWKELKEVLTGENKTGDFESSFLFNTSNVTQEDYNKFLIKIKDKGVLTKEIEDYLNSPTLAFKAGQLIEQKSGEGTNEGLKKILKGAIIETIRIKRNPKLQKEIIKWILT